MRHACLFVTLLVLALRVFAAPAPVPVIVTTLEKKPFVEQIEALGTLRSGEAVTLSATVTDTVRAIHFDDGTRVEANKVLVEMTRDEEHALLQEAQSTLDEATRQYERVQSLVHSGLTTQSTLDERKRAFEAAQAQLQATQSRLADRLIVAPFPGVVGLRMISAGTLVRPGDTITTLDDDRVMKLDFSVPAVFLSTLQPGLNITAAADAFGKETFNGKVASIDSRIDPNTRSIVVRAEIPNPDFKLKAGMLMTVQLAKAESQSLLLPEEALIQEGFKKFVFLVNPGEPATVTRKQIETGPRRRGEVVVLDGLVPGDKVVIHGVMHLREGTPIRVTGEKTDSNTIAELISQKPAGTP